MTTKKKPAPKATGEKSKKATAAKAPAKALTEPTATATRATMKADKVEVKVEPKAEAKVEAPVAPTVAAKAAAQVAVQAEQIVAEAAKPIAITTSTEKPVLTIGMFQKRLHERGYYHGWWDGQYGPMTKHAVARFQADHGLHPDGEPTPATLTALGL